MKQETLRRIAVGDEWEPKKSFGKPLPWKVTKVFESIHGDGERVFQIEKYQGGRNSPALITGNRLHTNFRHSAGQPKQHINT